MSRDHEIMSIEDEMISSSPRSARSTCKYRVPAEMSMSKNLFKPRLVSLGPIHHGDPELQAMEEHKKRYALSFIKRAKLTKDQFLNHVKGIEQALVDEYYEENKLPVSGEEEFLEIMFTDGAFLLEFLLRLYFQQWEEIDRMSQKRWTILKFDMLLLENQLPFRLLEHLYSKLKLANPSIKDLIKNFFVESQLLWDKHVIEQELEADNHLLSIIPFFMQPRPQKHRFIRGEPESTTFLTLPSCPTISELHRAGVKFRHSSGKYDDVGISFERGVLEIPTLVIDENTERFFANLLAYEMCTGKVHHVSDYVAMMDFLIDRPEDIKLLVKHGIIKNFLKDDEAASNLINYLGKNIAIYENFCYSYLVESLNQYCTTSWAKWQMGVFEWKMDLKQNYIGNPWKLLSVIAAVVLLVLTIIQTVCSILQLK